MGKAFGIWKEEEVTKKRFPYCIDPYSVDTILYFRAIQGHSGGNPLDPSLQDNVMLPNDFSSTSITLGTLTTCIPSSDRD